MKEEFKELWIDLDFAVGIYKISNTGKIKRISRLIVHPKGNFICKEKILKTSRDGGGYTVVRLWINGIKSSKSISRMVALHFIHNPLNLPEVNHKDCNKDNNYVSNLEWMTKPQNMEHAIENDRMAHRNGETNPSVKLTEANVIKIRSMHPALSYRKIAEKFGVDHSTIYLIVKRKKWQHI